MILELDCSAETEKTMKDNFYLKSDMITITPSNREDLWESDWNIAFRKVEKEQIALPSMGIFA